MRYEIKFILDEVTLSEFMSWVLLHTEFKEKYAPRYVNNLYFDDIEFQSVRDNLAGISNRKKLRLRWYHKENVKKISTPVLEYKIRRGRLGYKKSYSLPILKPSLMETPMGKIFDSISSEIKKERKNEGLFEDYYFSTLHVTYLREYFEDRHGLRLTIDKKIDFYAATPMSFIGDSSRTAYPKIIAELKFSEEKKYLISALLETSHFSPMRHSKYLAGLASFGQVIYL